MKNVMLYIFLILITPYISFCDLLSESRCRFFQDIIPQINTDKKFFNIEKKSEYYVISDMINRLQDFPANAFRHDLIKDIKYYPELKKINRKLLQELENTPQTYIKFDCDLILDKPYKLISIDEEREIWPVDSLNHYIIYDKNGNWIDRWGNFYKKYPGSTGIYGLSSVAFNKKQTEAIFIAGFFLNDAQAIVHLIYCKKEKGKWIIKEMYQLAIA